MDSLGIKKIIRFVIPITALLLLSFPTNAADRVTLQLRWDHQFQFAGYYAALWQGYYTAAGLDVDIRSAINPDRTRVFAVKEVSEGRADFGIGSVDALVARDGGMPLVLAAAIFQQSAVGVFAKSETNLNSPADLVSLKVRRTNDDLPDVELQAMLRAEGIDPDNVGGKMDGHGFNMLVEGEIDAYAGYTLTALWRSKKQGQTLTILRPSTYGIDFYGDGLITSDRLIKSDPEMVERFVNASLKGWRYALEHPEEVISAIVEKLPRTMPIDDLLGFNQFQSEEVKKLTLYPIVELGHINPERWRRIYEELKNAKMVKGTLDLNDFIFDPIRQSEERQTLLQNVLLVGFVIVVFFAFFFFMWTRTLRATVAEQTATLHEKTTLVRVSLGEAEKANKSKSEFLAVMSHDLRTPLNAIMGFAEMMKEHSFGPLGDSHYDEYAEDIHKSGKNLVSLINGILDLSKIEAGKYELTEEALDIASLIKESVELNKAQAEAKNIRLADETGPGVPMLYADDRPLMQILNNLISNAIKFTQEGGNVTASVKVDGNGSLVIQVADNGEGISDKDIARALEPFEQVDSSQPKKHEGTGLGLYICSNLIALHGGSMELKSKINIGTTITVRFPPERTVVS